MNATPVTVSITRTVKRGCEADFERELHDFVQRSFTLPGQHGVHVMRPAPGSDSREYGIVRKFASREALEEFRVSPQYVAWSQLATELTEGQARYEELTGLESWFTLPGAPLMPLPQWKMAIATFLGVLPVAMILNLTIGPVIGSWPFVVSNIVFNACVVASLTWVVMPLITRALHGWLHGDNDLNERKISS
jgi:antibiotic biosynthesis monooxygenase (ABM) superfamily enzyme